MDVKTLQARLAAHAVERNWDPFFSPRSVSMAVASEAGTLLARFQWLSEDQARRVGKTPDRAAISEALADIVLYAMRLAEILEIDLEEAIDVRATEKYPVSARRFEGVEEEPRAREPAPTASSPRESVTTARPAPPPAATRTAPVREEPTLPAPARSHPARPAEEDSGKGRRTPPDLTDEAFSRGSSRGEAQARHRPDPPVRERVEAPPRTRSEPPSRSAAEQSARERAAPPPRRAEPPRKPEPPLKAERYANLNTNAVLDLMKALRRRIDDSRADDTILQEIKDEMDTLRRNVYSSKTKPAWVAGGLERLRSLLEEAAGLPVGDKVPMREFIEKISGILAEE